MYNNSGERITYNNNFNGILNNTKLVSLDDSKNKSGNNTITAIPNEISIHEFYLYFDIFLFKLNNSCVNFNLILKYVKQIGLWAAITPTTKNVAIA